MKNFISYDTGGFIKQTSAGINPPNCEGLTTIEADADVSMETHYVSGGVPTRYTNEQLVAKKLPRVRGVVWSNLTMSWEDLRTLQQHKDAKWAEIKTARSTAEESGFTWEGSTFDSNQISQGRITAAVTSAQSNPSFSTDWVLSNNNVRTLNATDMIAVGQALAIHIETQFTHAQALRILINNATTAEEVDNIFY